MTGRASVAQSEDALQLWTADYLRRCAPSHCLYWHTPNEGKRSPTTGRRLRERGLLPGVADWCLVYQGRAHFIELKVGRNAPSPAQEAFMHAAAGAGSAFVVVRTERQFLAALDAFGIPRIDGRKHTHQAGVSSAPITARHEHG